MKMYSVRAKQLLWAGALAGSLLLSPMASATEVGGVALAEQITIGQQSLVLNGAGVRKKFVFDVYVAALYTPAASTDASAIINSTAPRRIQLTLLRDIDSATLMEALNDGLKDNTSAQELTDLAPAIAQFETMMNNGGKGQVGNKVVLDFNDQGVKVDFKEQPLGQVADPRFAAALMRVWLGDKPAQGSLKQALLGQNNK